jgi:hypothetical protein
MRWHGFSMQTVLDLQPSALEAARKMAVHEQISLDDAVSRLILQAVALRDEAAAGFEALDRGEYVELDREKFFLDVSGKREA